VLRSRTHSGIGEHLEASDLARFIAGALPRRRLERLVRHLLAGCSRCQVGVESYLRAQRRKRIPFEAYQGRVLEVSNKAGRRFEPEHWAVERVVASALLPLLTDGRSLPEQEFLVRHDPGFRSWALVEVLLEESQQAVWSSFPERSVELAQSAALVADHLADDRFGACALNDLKARVHAHLGNALRIRADFLGAARAFERAKFLLERGSGDPLESAWLIGLEASLLTDRGHLDEAIDLLRKALPTYDAIGESRMRARVEIQIVIALLLLGTRAEEALALAERAERSINRQADPRLFFSARHSRIAALCDAGQTREALLLLEDSRDLCRQFPDPWSQLRLRWLEARIAAGLGRTQEAEAMLGRLWTVAFERGLRFEVALISLDLAAIYIQLGRYLEAGQLAGRLISLFESWGVHRRAIQAWVILEHALIAETATVELVSQIAAYVRRGWRNPEIPLPKESPASVR
jgi:tetratricopeptide (TPR) repeat protein